MNPFRLTTLVALCSLNALANEEISDTSELTWPETVEVQACRPTIACMAEIVHAGVNLMLSVYDLGGTPIPQGLSMLAVAFDLGKGWGFFTELYSTWGNAQAVPDEPFVFGVRRGDLRAEPREPAAAGAWPRC